MNSPRGLLGVTFVALGTLHFLRPRMYEKIMPDYLPAQRGLVLASGAAEIVGGAGVLFECTRSAAGWWLIATLVAIFPANVHMALNPDRYPAFRPALLWGRLPLQTLFIWWARRVTSRRGAKHRVLHAT
ncbi:MAG: DoxX family protein [Actinobacteria bacterium]|nr:DoxX family protein [Actinomycetota bacterium]